MKEYKEVTCNECKLPSAKGLPPLRSVGDVMRHDVCPADPEAIQGMLDERKRIHAEDYERMRKASGQVVSYTKRDGEMVRTVIA